MKRRQRRKGSSPAAAIGFLLVSAGIAFFGLRSQFGGGGLPAAPATGDDLSVEEIGDAPAEAPGVDLLLRHGSWDPSEPVRMAFASAVVAAIAAAPAGEADGGAGPHCPGIACGGGTGAAGEFRSGSGYNTGRVSWRASEDCGAASRERGYGGALYGDG